MTVYRINCHKCTNKALGDNGDLYCLPARMGNRTIYIEDGHAGTKADPDPICCDLYTLKDQQMRLIHIGNEVR